MSRHRPVNPGSQERQRRLIFNESFAAAERDSGSFLWPLDFLGLGCLGPAVGVVRLGV